MSLTDDILMHYGMPRRSGRYPWGSGDNPYQHSGDFLSRVEELKKSNFTFTDKDGKTYTGEVAIAKSMGLSTTQFRTQMSLAKDERRSADVATAKALRAKGYSLNEIADKMGFANDSSVRSLLNESSEARMNQAKQTAEFLKKQISEKGMIDVGTGVERELGISKEKMNQALYILEMEGYPIYGGGVPQVTNPGKQTNIKVLCPPGTEHKEIYNFENVHSVRDYVSHDDGETFDKFVYPKSMDSSRLKIRYAEDGGIQKDGVIEIRRGVDDLSLGDSHYAQVRILVDGNRYLKGMAVYSDDLPDGVDVMFNTNKKKGTPTSDVLKKVKDDPDNPFGSLIKAGGQSYYIDADGKRQLSLINKRAEEGDWGEWADKLPSQFLSKQSLSLVNKQLNLAASDKMAEFDEICSLTNPTVKKSLLKSFADDCDSAAVHLQAAALPRQKYQVILPITSMKDNEVYAPNYKNGETVALVRYPHGGTFEIPILTVNNKQAEARRILGNTPKDAIGINSKVAERLSGADFDGDTVMVIPCNSGKSKVKITSTPPLKGLEGFDPKLEYGGKPAGTFKPMKNTQKEMGVISNLITDMTLKGATQDELARAVRHSMVHGPDPDQRRTALGRRPLCPQYLPDIRTARRADRYLPAAGGGGSYSPGTAGYAYTSVGAARRFLLWHCGGEILRHGICRGAGRRNLRRRRLGSRRPLLAERRSYAHQVVPVRPAGGPDHLPAQNTHHAGGHRCRPVCADDPRQQGTCPGCKGAAGLAPVQERDHGYPAAGYLSCYRRRFGQPHDGAYFRPVHGSPGFHECYADRRHHHPSLLRICPYDPGRARKGLSGSL